ncbi:MAG: hypothetical protein ACI8XO_004791 [Verrucomicrobiales bacterium]
MIRLIAILIAALAYSSNAQEQPALWSLSPIVEPQVPAVENAEWPIKKLDHFILAKIEEHAARPTPAADRRTLGRRAYLDLHGLPPTIKELDAFVRDNRPDAWPRLIESLLGSPRYGERWGRHWLDVTRYADSNGMDEDIAHPHAYRYRDYVIAAFNDDKPFDQFIIEQLAGDLLPAEDLDQRRAQTIAAGFLSIGPKMLACDDPDKMRRDIVDDQIDTTGRTFLGLTLGCARCHDHKFDPISIEDYYGLAGIFMSTKTLTKYSVVAQFHQHDLSTLLVQAKHEQLAALQKNKNHITKKEIERLQKDLPPRFKVMSITENPTEDSKVHLRGDYTTLGDRVPRRLPIAIAGDAQPAMPPGQSGRLELAEWIASGDNPLTARVIANRIWHWHFGRGIVETLDNFGVIGLEPTHPELLDHLARFLIGEEWSIKALHREIMTSATYQQSSLASRALKENDPENKRFARWLPRRIESEAVRDSILARSGQLDFESTGPRISYKANQYVNRDQLANHHEANCRTVYLPVFRSSGYDSQNAFDFPDPATICGSRSTSTVAPQALFLMNSPMVHKASAKYAESLLQIKEPDRATTAIRHLLGRDPSSAELERCAAFIKSHSPDDPAAAWAAFTRVLFATNEFLYIE